MSHYSVLLNESVELLNIKSDGVYIDGTFGRGGHSKLILSKLGANGRLIAFDKDIEAINYAHNEISDSRFTIVHGGFTCFEDVLQEYNIKYIDGAIYDLGVSSPQLDDANRGFSVRFDGPLDMRMNNTSGLTAKDWINTVTEEDLANVLWQYGEEKLSRKIAREIVKKRAEELITTTTKLANIIQSVMPKKFQTQHSAIRSFQAIRIKINNELDDIRQLLDTLPYVLNKNGRMVVISFHSLEDRMIKNKFKELSQDEQLPKWVYKQPKKADFRLIAKKIRAGKTELDENNRSRSAIMRCIERVNFNYA